MIVEDEEDEEDDSNVAYPVLEDEIEAIEDACDKYLNEKLKEEIEGCILAGIAHAFTVGKNSGSEGEDRVNKSARKLVKKVLEKLTKKT